MCVGGGGVRFVWVGVLSAVFHLSRSRRTDTCTALYIPPPKTSWVNDEVYLAAHVDPAAVQHVSSMLEAVEIVIVHSTKDIPHLVQDIQKSI